MPHGLDWAVVGVLVLFVLVAVYVALRRRPTRHRDPRPGFLFDRDRDDRLAP